MINNSLIYKISLTLILIIAVSSFCNAQDLTYARSVVNHLASTDFYGRGYVNNGSKIAADYISKQFDSLNLQSFGKKHYQPFKISVNTFPGNMVLTINDQELTVGKDFIIDPGSPSVQGDFEVEILLVADILDYQKLSETLRRSSKKFVIIPPFKIKSYTKEEQEKIRGIINFLKYQPENPAAGLIQLTDEKLTWGGSTRQNTKPAFTVMATEELNDIKKVSVKVEAKFIENYKTQNVIGYVEGERNDSLIVLTAHYDHLGMMGEGVVFPGANDNSSGIAMLLNLAKYFQQNPPQFTTVFMALGAEELGLLGAKYFVENPLFELSKIKFLINFDLAGTGDDGIQVVNGKVYQDKFDQLVRINEEQQLLKQVKIRGEACNSDHCMFHNEGVPCFYIYTLGGIQAYHDIDDKAETLPLTEFEDYYRLITAFIETL